MKPILNLTKHQYDNLFVTSDLHFGHKQKFVYEARGYSSPEEMDEDIISVINEKVGENGILLHLGDLSLNTSEKRLLNIFSRLKINQFWNIWGNHNQPLATLKGKHDFNFEFCNLGHYMTMGYEKKQFVCFHFPIMTWDGMLHGSMHLCGHSHGKNPLSRIEAKQSKILDCGWDVHSKPISMFEIEEIMETKLIPQE
jgi:calcineurin-like phosphoesterase family protein